MKQLIIFSEYVQNNANVKDRLKSLLAQTINVPYKSQGKTLAKPVELTIDSYKHHNKYGGDNFDEMVYVAMGDSANPIYVREAEGVATERMRLVVTEIQYDKKLFQPGEMTIKMSITPNNNEKLTNKDYIQYIREIFLNAKKEDSKPTSVSVVGVARCNERQLDEKTRIKEYDLTNIAVRYLVFSFNLSMVNSTRYVTLHCYSPDKVLELGKYSKVYSGLQFGEEIVKGEMVSRFFFHPSMIECDATRLRNLSMFDETFNVNRELVQPYLVQYNESFYDFIKRVAVRCGEFMCYCDGKLCLGLPTDNKPKTLSGDLIYTYPDVNIDSDMSLKIDNFSSDYTYLPDEEKEKKEQEEAKQKEAEEFKNLTKEEIEKKKKEKWEQNYFAEKEKEKDIFYAPEYVDDEQQHLLNKKTDYVDSRSHWIETLAYETMGNVLSKSKNAISIATGFLPVAKEVATRLITKTSSEKNFDKQVSVYPDDMGIKRTDWEYKKGASSMQKFTIEDSTREKFLNEFYHKIEKGERAVERGKVDINFSDKIPELDLTDAVNLDDGIANYYIVSRMTGRFTNTSDGKGTKKQHSVEVVPTLNNSLEPAITNEGVVVLPPHCGIPHILKATAQEAVVMETKDPLQIGRVRVKYLWQGTNTALSPWIRVLVPFAGGGGGVFMTPAEHDHVMINYTGGNIERPYVSGYLYTAECFPNKGATAADKRIDYKYTPRSITSQNGHSITFKDDEPSSFLNFLVPPLAAVWNIASYIDEGISSQKIENLEKAVDEAAEAYHKSADDPELKKKWQEAKLEYLRAKDEQTHIMTMEDIPSNPLNGGMVFKDANGMYEVKLSATDRNISIKSPLGDIDMSAFTGINISAPNGDVSITGKNVSITAGNNLEIKSGVNIKDKIPYYYGTAARYGLQAAGMAIKEVSNMAISKGIGMLSPATAKVIEELKNWHDLSFIRNMWEVLMRPVEGTLLIKSKRNVLMMAGLGKAWVPTSLLSKAGTALEGGGKWYTLGLSATFGEENNQDLDYLHNKAFVILSLLRYTKQEVNNFYDNFSHQVRQMTVLAEKASGMINADLHYYQDEFNEKMRKYDVDMMIKAAWENYKIKKPKDILSGGFCDRSPWKNPVEAATQQFIDEYTKLRKLVKEFKKTYVDNENSLYESIERHWEGDAFSEKNYKAPDKPMMSTTDALGIKLETAEDLAKLIKKPVSIPAGLTKTVMKNCIYEVLRGFDDSKYFSIEDDAKSGVDLYTGSDEDWQEMIDCIVPYEMSEEEKAEAENEKAYQERLTYLAGPIAKEWGIERNVTKNGQWWSVPGIQELVNWKGAAGPRAFCEYASAGNFLIANNKSFTYKLGDDAAGFEAMRNPDLDAIKEYLRSVLKNTEPLVIT